MMRDVEQGENWVDAAGVRLRVYVEGSAEKPWLMFCNSVATDLALWDDQVAAFRGDYRIVRYDHRGHGATSGPQSDYSIDDLAQDAAAILAALDVRDAIFVGASIGGVTGMRLASRFTDRLKALVLCDCQWATVPGLPAAWEARVALARDNGMQALVEPTLERWFPAEVRAANPVALDRVREMIRRTSVAGFIGCARALQDYDCRDDFRGLQLPTLLLVGAQDGKMPAAMREMHAALPTSSLTEIPQAGHLPNIEKPELFNRALEAFLDQIRSQQN